MTEQAPAHLIKQLEHRTQCLVDGLGVAHSQLAASQAHQALLEQQIQALEARQYELQEECRGLSERNDELERHNQHLQARLEQSGAQQFLSDHARQPRDSSVLNGQDCAAHQTPVVKPECDSVLEPCAQTSDAAEPDVKDVKGVSAPSPQALLKEWYKRYDRAFFKNHTLPLKVGIHQDLAAAEPWPEKLVRRALACYVNLPRYLKAVRKDAPRIDLQGQPAGSVDQGAAEYAQGKLAHLQASRGGRQTSGADKAAHKTAAHKKVVKRKKTQAVKPRDTEVSGSSDVSPDDPAERMQNKLDALMARHDKH